MRPTLRSGASPLTEVASWVVLVAISSLIS
jgi:hypothetical protein